MRHLNEDARAVTGIDLAAAGAPVEEVLEHLQGLAHDGVRAPALDVHHEADAAGIVLVGGVVKALGGRQPRGGGVSSRRHRSHGSFRIVAEGVGVRVPVERQSYPTLKH
jgi:hypothetical protein